MIKNFDNEWHSTNLNIWCKIKATILVRKLYLQNQFKNKVLIIKITRQNLTSKCPKESLEQPFLCCNLKGCPQKITPKL